MSDTPRTDEVLERYGAARGIMLGKLAKELERELNATVGALQLVWPFLHEDDGHGANAPTYQNAINAVKAVLAVKKGGQA
jgi:hypothetical protein